MGLGERPYSGLQEVIRYDWSGVSDGRWCVQLRVVRSKWDFYERERGGFDWQRQVEVSERRSSARVGKGRDSVVLF